MYCLRPQFLFGVVSIFSNQYSGHGSSIVHMQVSAHSSSTPLGSHVFISDWCDLLQNIVSLSQTVAKCVWECQAIVFFQLQAL